MKNLFYPINFEVNNLGKKLISPVRIWVALAVFALSTVFTFAYTIRTLFKNEATRNILGGIVVILLTTYLTYFIIVRLCLREKKLMNYYNKVNEFQNRPVYDLFNIVDVDKSFQGIPMFICSTGVRLMGFKLYPDSIIGKTSEEQVEEHYEVVHNMLGHLALNFPTCWCLYLTSSHGIDRRWEQLIKVNVKNPCPVIKRIVNGLIVFNQGIKDNLINEYYFVVEPISSRPTSRMVDAMMDCVAYGQSGFNVGYEFVDEEHMTDILEQLFVTDKSFSDLKTSLDRKNTNKETKFIQLTKVIKNDGTVIDLLSPQGGNLKNE